MKSDPLVSIVIATFNSERTLPLVLDSIRKQTYPQHCIEILIIDGGSTDTTLVIARKFHCRVINNLKVEPLYAKYLGYCQARGKYITYIDHDEVIGNPESIVRKVAVFCDNQKVKAVVASGYSSPKGYHIINRYINEFGDAFSFFIYRLSKNGDFFLKTMRERYTVIRDEKYCTIVDLSSSQTIPLIELGAGGGMFDGDFFKQTFPEIKEHYHLIPHFLHLLRGNFPFLAIMKNDVLIHYSSDNFGGYIKKIIWRVKNNIFFKETIGASGFSGRENYQSSQVWLKKFIFLPYAFTLIGPTIDAIYLIITRRDVSYIIHIPLTIITASLIVYYSMLKTLGLKPRLTSYDGSTPAYEK